MTKLETYGLDRDGGQDMSQGKRWVKVPSLGGVGVGWGGLRTKLERYGPGHESRQETG